MNKLLSLFVFTLFLSFPLFSFAQDSGMDSMDSSTPNQKDMMMMKNTMSPADMQEMNKMSHDMMMKKMKMMTRQVMKMSMKMYMMGKMMSMSEDAATAEKGKKMMKWGTDMMMMGKEMMKDNNMTMQDIQMEPMMKKDKMQ